MGRGKGGERKGEGGDRVIGKGRGREKGGSEGEKRGKGRAKGRETTPHCFFDKSNTDCKSGVKAPQQNIGLRPSSTTGRPNYTVYKLPLSVVYCSVSNLR